MSTYDLTAEGYPVSEPAPVLDAPEQAELPVLTEARIIKEIADAHTALYSPGSKMASWSLYGQELPSTPIPAGDPEDRQRVALADLELYKRAASSRAMRMTLGDIWRVRFDGYSWNRDDIAHTPIYTETALLNPNFALAISFDLDPDGYALTSRARLLMSRDKYVLMNALRLAGPETDPHR